MVSEVLSDCKYTHVLYFFNEVHFEQIRNTFFHSGYGISEGDYILFDSDPIKTTTFNRTRVSIVNFLLPLIDKTILFFEQFKDNYLQSFKRYTKEIEIKGYFPNLKDVVIHGTSEGLKGVTIKRTAQFYGEWVDSGIYYDKKYRFWYAKNIQFNFPQIESIEIDEALTRYESKQDIKTSNSEFFNLVDKISDRNLKSEMERIIDLLIKFGNTKYDKWSTEQNEHKKRSIKKLPLPFYEKATQLNKHLNLSEIIKRMKELEKE